jgi:hypothetical protein
LMVKVVQFLSPRNTCVDYGIRLDARVLTYALAALLLSVLLAGIAPVRLALRLDIWDVIASEQGVTGARGGWQKRALIAGQVPVSVALVGCAFLFITSLHNAVAIHPGLDPPKKLLVLNVIPAKGGRDACVASRPANGWRDSPACLQPHTPGACPCPIRPAAFWCARKPRRSTPERAGEQCGRHLLHGDGHAPGSSSWNQYQRQKARSR